MTLSYALQKIAGDAARVAMAGRDTSLSGVDVALNDDADGFLSVIVELGSGDMLPASFIDSERWTDARRDELEALFASTAALSAAVMVCQPPGGPH